MRISVQLVRRLTALCMIVLLASPLTKAQSQSDSNSPAAQTTEAPPAPQAQTQNPSPAQTPNSQANASPQQSAPTQPIGTAVAPAEKSLGVAASRPAGAAIAPPKQRRARSVIIKVGVIVGACVAVGTVVGLSRSSPSQPH